MNSKAIKRQLLAAIAMVLVAAIALGSSTYAWFVASGTVTAKDMKVTVQAESGLMIRVHTDSENTNSFGTVASLNNDAKPLTPVSTNNLTDWYHNNSNVENESKGGVWNSSKGALYQTIVADKLDNYVLKTRFAIRSATSEDIEKVQLQVKSVKAEGTSSTSELNKSIRVGLKLSAGAASNDSTMLIYAPNREEGDASSANGNLLQLKAYYKTSADQANVTLSEYTWRVKAGTENDRFPLSNNTIPADDDGLIVDVFVWYEGEDFACTSYHAKSATPDELNVSIEFEQFNIPQTGG